MAGPGNKPNRPLVCAPKCPVTYPTSTGDVRQLQIEDIKRLVLEPGDILVVKVADRVTADQAHRIKSQVQQIVAGHEVLVVDRVEFQVLRDGKLIASTADQQAWRGRRRRLLGWFSR